MESGPVDPQFSLLAFQNEQGAAGDTGQLFAALLWDIAGIGRLPGDGGANVWVSGRAAAWCWFAQAPAATGDVDGLRWRPEAGRTPGDLFGGIGAAPKPPGGDRVPGDVLNK
ncbi:MAG: hypothetical protein R2762_25940 [Bryobacteraceae bacterium]